MKTSARLNAIEDGPQLQSSHSILMLQQVHETIERISATDFEQLFILDHLGILVSSGKLT